MNAIAYGHAGELIKLDEGWLVGCQCGWTCSCLVDEARLAEAFIFTHIRNSIVHES